MATPKILIKRSNVAGRVPTSLDSGELALNTADGKIYYTGHDGAIHAFMDSAGVNTLINNSVSTLDSGNVTDMIDSDYIQTRQITYTIPTLGNDFVDSAQVQAIINAAYVKNIVDSAYVASIVETDGDINITINNEITSTVDSAYVQARVDATDFLDSAEAIALIDSAHVRGKIDTTFINSLNVNSTTLDGQNGDHYLDYNNFTNTPTILDNIDVQNQIDSAYVQLRQEKFDTSDFTDSAYVKARIDSAISDLIGGAPEALNTLNELAEALNDDSAAYDTLLAQIDARLDSAEATALIDSAYIRARQIKYLDSDAVKLITLDSSEIPTVVTEAYVRARQDFRYNQLTGAPGALSDLTNDLFTSTDDLGEGSTNLYYTTARTESDAAALIDSAYIQARQSAGTDSAATIALITSTVDSAYVQLRETAGQVLPSLGNDFVDSAEALKIVDANALDSARATSLIDSAYVQLRQTAQDFAYSSLTDAPTIPTLGTDFVDSGQVEAIVDSAYVQLRQDYAYGSLTGTPTIPTLGTDFVDSGQVEAIVDSAYVQLRQTAQDFAYSSLTGAPTTVSSFTNDANYLDSTTVLPLIPKFGTDYVDSSTVIDIINSEGLDSDLVIALVDSAYIQLRDRFQDSSLVTSTVDNAYVQARQIKYSTADFADSAFVTSQGYLDHYDESDTLATVTGRGATTTTNVTFNGTGNSVLIGDTLRIDSGGSGLRMTNVGAFDRNGDNFRIFATRTLQLGAGGDGNVGLSIDSGQRNVTIENDLIYRGQTVTIYESDAVTAMLPTLGTDFVDSGQVDAILEAKLGAANEIVVVDSAGGNVLASTSTLTIDPSSTFVGINQTSPEVTLHMTGEGPQTAQIRMEQYNNTADAPDMRTRRYRGTEANPLNIQTGDYLYRTNVEGYKDSAITDYASMQFDVDATDADGLHFKLTGRDRSGTSAVRLEILDGAIRFNEAYTFPTADGTSGQFLKTDGEGNLSYDSAASPLALGTDYIDSAEANILINAIVDSNGLNFIRVKSGDTVEPVVSGHSGIGIGNDARSTGVYGTAIGYRPEATSYSVAIGGVDPKAQANFSVAIGDRAKVSTGHDYSVALGKAAETTASNQIMLGAKDNSLFRTTSVRIGNPHYEPTDSMDVPTKKYVDSQITTVIDSAYITSRETAQDFAYSSLTGAPTIPALGTDFVDSGEALKLIDANALDSARAISLIDSAYIQARQVDLQRDSAFVTGIIDSDYVRLQTRIGDSDIDFGSHKIRYSNVYSAEADLPDASTYHGMFAHVHATGAGYFAHGGNWIRLANQSEIFDGAYSSLTGTPTIPAFGTDYVDSAFVTSQLPVLGTDFIDSAEALKLIDANALDSGRATTLIDSAYVQARQTAGTDSAATIALIEATVDSAYVQLRQTAGGGGGGGGLDSAAVTALIDSQYIIDRIDSDYEKPIDQVTFVYTADSGQTAFVDSDDNGTIMSFTADQQITVYLNGLLLTGTSDVSVTPSTNTVTLTEAADSGDVITVVKLSGSKPHIDSSMINNIDLQLITYVFTADSNESAFEGVDDRGKTMVLSGNERVSVNGILLLDSDDYSVSNNKITLLSATDSGDIVTIERFKGRDAALDSSLIANSELIFTTYKFTAGAGDTVFTGADDNGNTLSYSSGKIRVHLNGILLVDSDDYTATSNTTLTLTQSTNTGDIVTIEKMSGRDVGVDSAGVQLIVDSAYINARVTSSDGGLDSSLITQLIDSAYPIAFAKSITGFNDRPSVLTDSVYGSGGGIAIGWSAKADYAAIAIGTAADARNPDGDFGLAEYSIAMGRYSRADKKSSVAIGHQARVHDSEGTALGGSAYSWGVGSVSIGRGARARQDGTVAIGDGADASKIYSVALGYAAIATDSNQMMLGYTNNTYGLRSIRVGNPDYDPSHDQDLVTKGYVDSQITVVIDSDYINNRVTSSSGIDSAEAIKLITANAIDSGVALELLLDSIETIALIDSAYVQERQITYSNADFLDSNTITGVVDSAYVRIRVPTDQDLRTTSDVEFNKVNSVLDGAIQFTAKNASGATLTKGTVVYISGISGNTPTVDKAQSSDAAKMPAFGIVAADANNNANVNVYTFGTLTGIDTSAFDAGDTLFVSTTAGELTNVKPASESNLLQNIGRVIRSDASAGSIKVGGAGRTNAVPNLDNDQFFLGNDSNYAVAVDFTTTVEGVVDSAYVQLRQEKGSQFIAVSNDATADKPYVGNNTNSIAIGVNANTDATRVGFPSGGDGAIAIGDSATTTGHNTIAIGHEANTGLNTYQINNVALGYRAHIDSGNRSIAIGSETDAKGHQASAIGANAQATKTESLAVGQAARAEFVGSTAIGRAAIARADNQMVLGQHAGGSYPTTSIQPGNVDYEPTDSLDLVTKRYVDSQITIVIDSAYVQERQTTYSIPTLGTDFIDSAEAIKLITANAIDSGVALELLLDSIETIALIDSDYIRLRTRIGDSDIDFGSNKILYSNVYSAEGDLPSASTYHGMFAHVHGTGAGYFAHAGNWVRLANQSEIFDGAYSSLTGTPTIPALGTDYVDSAQVEAIIDSAYVQARQTAGTDSAATIALIEATVDSAYVQLREAAGGGGSGTLDSASAIALIDSAYVQARQTSSTGLDSAGTLALINDTHLTVTTYVYTADSAGHLTYEGADDNGAVLALSSASKNYRVSLNGILLLDSDDFTATDTKITLTSNVTTSDILTVETFKGRHVAGGINSYRFTPSAGTTTITGEDVNGKTLNYTEDQVQVFLNGIALIDSADFTATSGTSIVLDTATASGDEILIQNFIPSSERIWTEIASSVAVGSNTKNIVNVSGNSVTLTFPSNPTFGDEIRVIDGFGNAATNNIVINRNGNKIQGAADDFRIDVDRAAVGFVYYNATQGWILIEN